MPRLYSWCLYSTSACHIVEDSRCHLLSGPSSDGSVFFHLLRGATADALSPAESASFSVGAMVTASNLHIHTKLMLDMSGVWVLVAPVLSPCMACVQHYTCLSVRSRAMPRPRL